jgi:hypothetical protein
MHETSEQDGLDRRNFMLASAASVGAAAAVVLNAAAANAQTAAQPAPGSTDGTTYTGDVINGKPVVGVSGPAQ